VDDIETIATEPGSEFVSWLDGLASVMSAFHQHETTPVTGSNPTSTGCQVDIQGNPEMQSSQPEDTYLASDTDQPTQPRAEETATWDKTFPVAPDSQPVPDMPVTGESEKPTQAETAKMANPASQTGTAIEEENAHLWNELGSIYYNTGAYADAIHAFERAIELDRSYAWSYSNLASLYSRQGRYEEALPLYKKELSLVREAKDKALLWNRMGDTYRRLDQHDQAAAAYRKAMELDPNNVSLLTRARFSLLGNCRA
jgi:tetratricopeptide (TPR) repeat protein